MIIEPTEYKTAETKSKQRINSFSGTNKLGGIPGIVFNEELVTHDPIADRTIKTPVGSCAVSLTDPAKPLTLRNPLDDTIIPIEAFIAKLTAQGGVVYEDEFILIYSLGRQTQIERDEALIAARNAPVEVI